MEGVAKKGDDDHHVDERRMRRRNHRSLDRAQIAAVNADEPRPNENGQDEAPRRPHDRLA